ncbi:general transcription factor 3C polypeptide 6 [Halyomorpha halys]|uniref:general transcription factor 3C polypeptide 6 n=1 Tax=Halyomorpha halys TaxID=286706 RepID=UPI0006D4D21E|nr:general transcription factor 3C polypeptide 6 [Halyomorpha halys]
MDVEGDSEDLLVYMDFNTKIEDVFFSSDKEFKIVGLESQKPILQLGNQVYQGEWRDTVGTHLFFEEVEENHQNPDPLFSENPEKTLSYRFKTDKLLHMSRIFLKPNAEKETESVTNEYPLQQPDVSP